MTGQEFACVKLFSLVLLLAIWGELQISAVISAMVPSGMLGVTKPLFESVPRVNQSDV